MNSGSFLSIWKSITKKQAIKSLLAYTGLPIEVQPVESKNLFFLDNSLGEGYHNVLYCQDKKNYRKVTCDVVL